MLGPKVGEDIKIIIIIIITQHCTEDDAQPTIKVKLGKLNKALDISFKDCSVTASWMQLVHRSGQQALLRKSSRFREKEVFEVLCRGLFI